MNQKSFARLQVISAMVIWGTIGVFVRYIPLPSAAVSMFRGMIGAPFLLIVLLFQGRSISWSAIRQNFIRLFLCGTMLGLNWILLFEAYRYTGVATATLCYYLAPIFIVAVSPFVFRERITLKKLLCVTVALIGMVFVSGVVQNGIPAFSERKGILLGIAAAVLYAAIVINNKKLKDIPAYDQTVTQLAISAIVLLPYNLLNGNLSDLTLTPSAIILLLVVGIVHTGISYYLYFGATERLPAQTLAILSYIDPAAAILLSALVLRERIGVFDIIGAVLILGAAMVSEYSPAPKQKNNIRR